MPTIIPQAPKTLEIPSGDFGAYLFDLDGTVVDSMPLHHESWSLVLKGWNCTFSEELFYKWAGVPIPKLMELLNKEHGISLPVDEVIERKEQMYMNLLDRLKPIPSVLEHIQDKRGKIPFAIVSGSPRSVILATLNSLKILDHFDAIVGAEDYVRGKPHPEPFLLAAKLLKIAPEKCLVFEDATFGIESAIAAGMKWVRVPPRN